MAGKHPLEEFIFKRSKTRWVKFLKLGKIENQVGEAFKTWKDKKPGG